MPTGKKVVGNPVNFSVACVTWWELSAACNNVAMEVIRNVVLSEEILVCGTLRVAVAVHGTCNDGVFDVAY